MKNITFSALVFLFYLNACNSKVKTFDNKLILPEMICNSGCFNYNLSDSLVYEKVKNQRALSKYKVNDSIKRLISYNTEFYDDVYYYHRLKVKNSEVFIFYGNSDYYKDFILVTFLNDKIIDAKIISSILGDGDYFYFKNSTFKDSVFYSKFIEGSRTFTTPDTIYFKLKGLSQIKIDYSTQIINEDTIQSKINFQDIVKSIDYKVENNY